ncbi:hypothetical protein R0131_12240 [Clostridium sp. AL.422]|uniref:hypothetical protein n=1 Tax=Clostridium TaxID=1485 RepID=UPI00293DF33B|nr:MULTISPECIES: hypothetical protein [unclassified Clostridium]MDV4151599.1 hypothetical protein [Clostridium sp. AL.422]
MRKYLKLLPILTFVLLIIGTVPVKSEPISDDFYFLEEEINNYGMFIENGVRIEYSTNNNIEDEIQSVKNNIEKQFKGQVNIDKNTIAVTDEYRDIKVVVWQDMEDTKVQISYVNYNNKQLTNQLMKEIEQIQNFAAKKIKYFNFLKVKIIEERKQNILDLLMKNVKENTLEELNVFNGKVSKGRLIDGSKINFSFMTYDDEEYLVLGTPVIFVTY